MSADLTTFARNLCWTPALLDCCRAWLADGGAVLDRQFRDYCAGNPRLAWLLAAYRGLPDGLRKEFLLSPRISSQLLGRTGHVPAFAELAPDLVRVLARATDGAAVDPDLAGMLAAFGKDNGEVRGIPLDFDSAFSFPPRGPSSGELHVVQPNSAAQTRSRLEAVLDVLAQGNPVALDYVCLLTRRLAVREESLAGSPVPSGYGNLGPGLIGFTLLTNIWAEQVDTAWLVDALVHEAIHAGLFLYEAIHAPLLLDNTATESLRSPWTGNPLSCYYYVQACFVWFGLAQLWKSWPAAARGVSSERAEALYRRASQGFRARPVQALLSHPGGRLVAPLVQEALLQLEHCAS